MVLSPQQNHWCWSFHKLDQPVRILFRSWEPFLYLSWQRCLVSVIWQKCSQLIQAVITELKADSCGTPWRTDRLGEIFSVCQTWQSDSSNPVSERKTTEEREHRVSLTQLSSVSWGYLCANHHRHRIARVRFIRLEGPRVTFCWRVVYAEHRPVCWGQEVIRLPWQQGRAGSKRARNAAWTVCGSVRVCDSLCWLARSVLLVNSESVCDDSSRSVPLMRRRMPVARRQQLICQNSWRTPRLPPRGHAHVFVHVTNPKVNRCL